MLTDPLLLKRLFDVAVLPPGGPLVPIALGLLLWRRARRLAAGSIAVGLAASYLSATGALGAWLIGPLERHYSPVTAEALRRMLHEPADRRPQAIVVLGGGGRRGALDSPDGETVNTRTLERLAAGVRAQRATGLPLLVSGGRPTGARRSEGEVMARALADMGGQARWIESGSLDTADNATGTRDMLTAHGIRRVLLVTHAYHLPRAVAAFEHAGLEVRPVPAAWLGQPADNWRAWMPGVTGLETTWTALHERAGLAWYRLRGLAGRRAAQPDAALAGARGMPVSTAGPAGGQR